MITRQQYMERSGEQFRAGGDGFSAHREYYGQFAVPAVKETLRKVLGDRIKASTDPHFNDIPLREWDALPHIPEAAKLLHEATGMGPSQAEWTCIYKEAAMQIKEEG